MQSYLTKIKANIEIAASKKSTNVLDGSYVSVFKGRSMNFEDLREYIPGDNIRDIDWKASSRSGNILVKRYVAEKKHNILFVVDTDLRMLGETNQGDIKKDIALYSFGTIAYLAYKNGDVVGTVYMKEGKPMYEPFKSGVNNIERVLNLVDSEITKASKFNKLKATGINEILSKTISMFKKRMIVVILTDVRGAYNINEDVLKKVKCLHDVLVVLTDDANVSGAANVKAANKDKQKHNKKVFDLLTGKYISSFISEDKKLIRLEEARREELRTAVLSKFKKCGISSVCIDKVADVTGSVIALLKNHKNIYKH